MQTLDDPQALGLAAKVFPFIPFALGRMQTDIAPMIFADIKPGVRASILHNLVMAEGRRAFDGTGDLAVRTKRGLDHFCGPAHLCRVKHADKRSLEIAVNNTFQTFEWDFGAPLPQFADPRLRLYVVYAVNDSWTQVTRAVLALYRGKRVIDFRDIDIDEWYDANPIPFIPTPDGPDVKPLTLKPGIVTIPLEEGHGSGQ